MAKLEVEGAWFQPCMDSFLGAAKGVIESFGEKLPYEDLWGLSGLAFRTQVHRALSPAGLFPRRWDETYGGVIQRLGFACMAGLRDFFYTDEDIAYLRRGWMGNIERHLEDGLPAIAYGLHGPAFGIVNGFDDETENYRVSTFLDGVKDAPVNALELGLTEPPCVFVLIVTGPLDGYDRRAAAKQAIAWGLAHHAQQERDEKGAAVEVPADLATGMDAFEAWGRALHERKVTPPFGAALAAGYYLEARTHGAAWLRKLAKDLFPEQANVLERAAAHFEAQTGPLKELAGMFPPQDPRALEDAGRIAHAIGQLKTIAGEHDAAMKVLGEAR